MLAPAAVEVDGAPAATSGRGATVVMVTGDAVESVAVSAVVSPLVLSGMSLPRQRLRLRWLGLTMGRFFVAKINKVKTCFRLKSYSTRSTIKFVFTKREIKFKPCQLINRHEYRTLRFQNTLKLLIQSHS